MFTVHVVHIVQVQVHVYVHDTIPSWSMGNVCRIASSELLVCHKYFGNSGRETVYCGGLGSVMQAFGSVPRHRVGGNY